MRKELELRLQSEFPFMKSDCPRASYNFKTVDYFGVDNPLHSMGGRPRYSTYEEHGCECSDGWYEIIRGLCLDIVKAYEEAGQEIDLKPLQVKEKFGTLRFYYQLSATGESPISMDFLGVGRMMLGETQSEIGKTIREIVSKWEEASAKTCERCGAPGKLRDLSWIQTLCGSCFDNHKQPKTKDAPTWEWELGDDGTLIISGTGDMEHYEGRGHRFIGACRGAFGDKIPLIKTVIIKDGITSIGAGAFCGCHNLTSVAIPESVSYIGSSVFRDCESLTEVKLPEGVTIINSRLFEGCRSLKNVHIPSGVTFIAKGAFADCAGLTELKLPKGLRYIGSCAFQSCDALTEINIPASAKDIGTTIFADCHNLKNIQFEDKRRYSVLDAAMLVVGERFLMRYLGNLATDSCAIPNGIQTIERSAFAECGSLKSIRIPESVACIRDNAFWGCESLTEINIPDKVGKISSGVFHSCKSLKSVALPADLTYIDSWAFAGCENLGELVIPEGVEGIGHHAFDSCLNLVIRCREGSPAHEYATENEIKIALM